MWLYRQYISRIILGYAQPFIPFDFWYSPYLCIVLDKSGLAICKPFENQEIHW